MSLFLSNQMDTRPVITYYANNTSVPDKLLDKIVTNLPEECIEWQRSYGRSTKKVYLEASLLPFKENYLKENGPFEGKHNLLGRCLLHTYWLECSDIDVYKSTIREDVISWMNKLREYDIWDWLIVVVDSSEKKKTNKTKLLPRSTVADKVRSDFPSSVKDAADRCVSLINPLKNETTGSDSYEFFLDRLRLLLLKSYSKHLTRYEDFVRTQRERRNSKNWNFFSFFILQEELAFAFEMLSLFEDALVQYDELDALFSQFVINSHVIQPPDWLKLLIERCHLWSGLTLSKSVSRELREKIRNSTASLLDLRNYLFSRQCELLLMQHKPWDLSTRALPFLQNCVHELSILEINLPSGAVACWVFLSALEILQKCERYNDSSQMQVYSRYTIGLWAYARRKLEELGVLCGLMPGMNHDSECIHKVVSLIAGMGNDPYSNEKLASPSPQTLLKEALSKPEAFLKSYLEVSELTISTFKHIGRFRSGRLIGRELAFLYMKMNKHQQSIPFFLDLEKVFSEDRWTVLLADTRKHILNCYAVLGDKKKQLQYSLLLASSTVLEEDERKKYLTLAKETISSIGPNDSSLIQMEELFPIQAISLKSQGVFVTNSKIESIITLKSNLSETIKLKSLRIYLQHEPFSPKSKFKATEKHINSNSNSHGPCPHPFALMNRKNFRIPPKFETYHTSSEVGVKCPNLNHFFRRSEINNGPQAELRRNTSEDYFEAENLEIHSGVNKLVLFYEPIDSGCYTVDEICLNWYEAISFTHKALTTHLCFPVISEEPSLKLISPDGSTENPSHLEILSGPPQRILLRLNSGSYSFLPGSQISLKSSTDLFMQLEKVNVADEFSNLVEIRFDKVLEPFQNFDISLVIRSKFANQRGPSGFEHNIVLSYPDHKTSKVKTVSKILYLMPPFMSTLKLHTLNLKKFVEVIIKAVSSQRLELFDAHLVANDIERERNTGIVIKSLNPPQRMILYKDQTVHYIWDLGCGGGPTISKLLFSLKYNLTEELFSNNPLDYHSYECDFRVSDYTTLYTIRAAVEPPRGSEFCRVGVMCQLHVSIEKVCPKPSSSASAASGQSSSTQPSSLPSSSSSASSSNHSSSTIMYEVIADSNIWSLNGRTAGVLETNLVNKYNLVFDILPLLSGRLPVPTIRLSKYITSSNNINNNISAGSRTHNNNPEDNVPRTEAAKLVAFEVGQVYNWSRSSQANVLPPSGLTVN